MSRVSAPRSAADLSARSSRWSEPEKLTAFSIFAPPTAAGAQPIITIGFGNCFGAGPGLLAIAAEARDNGPAISSFGIVWAGSTGSVLTAPHLDSERFRPARLNGFVEGKNLAVIPGGFESTADNLAERAAASGY